MCQVSPGPRCSHHTLIALQAVETALLNAASPEEEEKLTRKYVIAQREYDASPDGLRTLQEQIATAEAEGEDVSLLTARYDQAQADAEEAASYMVAEREVKDTELNRDLSRLQRDLEKVERRISVEERIVADGSELTPDEQTEYDRLMSHPDALTTKEKYRLSTLNRIMTDGAELTPQEKKWSEKNRARQEELDATVTDNVLLCGAARIADLDKTRKDVLATVTAEYEAKLKKWNDRLDADEANGKTLTPEEVAERKAMKPTKAERKAYKRALTVLNSPNGGRDGRLDAVQAALADTFVQADPARFRKVQVYTSEGTAPLTLAHYNAERALVQRYKAIHPHYAKTEQRDAGKLINRLRGVAHYGQLVQKALSGQPFTDEDLSGVPAVLAAPLREGKLTPRALTLGVLHEKRMYLYGFHAARATTKKNVPSTPEDRQLLTKVKGFMPNDPAELSAHRLAQRKAELLMLEQRIKDKRYLTAEEVRRPAVEQPKSGLKLDVAATRRNYEAPPARVTASSHPPVARELLHPLSPKPASPRVMGGRELPHVQLMKKTPTKPPVLPERLQSGSS